MAQLYKTFKVSILSTLVFYGFIGFNVIFDINNESVGFIMLSIFIVYGSLFLSLAALNSRFRHRYVTFKYGLISVLSKWTLIGLSAFIDSENQFSIGLIVVSFFIAIIADIFMFLAIRKTDLIKVDQKIIALKPLLTEEKIQVKEAYMSQLFYFIMLFAFTAVTILRVDYYYDIVIHLILWIFIIKYVKKVDTYEDYQYRFVPTIIYLVVLYLGLLSVSYFTNLINSTGIALVFTTLMYLPYLQFFIRESLLISRYRDAQRLES